MTTCNVTGCKGVPGSMGLCSVHSRAYQQRMRSGISPVAALHSTLQRMSETQARWFDEVLRLKRALIRATECYQNCVGLATRRLWRERVLELQESYNEAMMAVEKNLPLNAFPVVLGLDPGSARFGYAVIRVGTKITVLSSGTIHVSKDKWKWGTVYKRIEQVCHEFNPSVCVAEEPIVYMSENHPHRLDTVIPLSQARGAALAAVQNSGIKEFVDMKPTEIKRRVTGSGKASKEQVIKAVQILTGVTAKTADEADAIAVAIAGHSAWSALAKVRGK